MKRNLFILLALTVIAMSSCKQVADSEITKASTPELDYFQLKIFNYETEEQVALLDNYFGDALLPALHRAGVENVGVFKPIEGLNESINYIMVLVPFQSLEQFEKLPALLEQDPAYQQAGLAYIDAPHDNPPFTRIESFILRAFSATPSLALPELTSPRADRVYELRSYEGATEKLYKLKVEMFNEGESALFQDLKFNPVFFCEVISSSHMPHLIYLTTHADTTAQKANWDAFVAHPEWLRMKELERYQNTVSSITKYLLYPTEYSDY
ncbi:MAG: NIPSNAP family protein [Bacteroidales bacterium]|nr:NIPSNAP family protein [Bacteroidales bacterium]